MTILSFRRSLGLASALMLLPIPVSHAQQTIERHLPPVPQGAPAPLPAPNVVPMNEDSTPIGPALRTIVLLGPQEDVHVAPPEGVSIGAIARLANSEDRAAIASMLQPFMGQPISHKLIAEIESAIARRYRELNFPFVSLSTPQQSLDGGALQIRIVEFKAGTVSVTGASESEAASIRNRIGLRPGDAIDTRALTDDLNWLNRYPYRQVQAVFTPGAALGDSDLTLTAMHQKPWQVYGGYNNDGSHNTTFARYFLGGTIGGLLGRDSLVSLQATVSGDAGDKYARYRSIAGNYVLPVGRRGQIEFGVNALETNSVFDPFVVRLRAVEANLGYRFPVAGFGDDGSVTDARFGIEGGRQTSTTYFGGLNAFEVSMNVYQFYAGLHHRSGDALGGAEWDVAVHLSPGGIGTNNGSARALLYTQGRLDDMRYAYITAAYDRSVKLAGGLSLETSIFGQYAPDVLPYSQQMRMGGAAFVRGYSLDNSAYDSALIIRNQLHVPVKTQGEEAQFSPYLFSDLGYARDNFIREDFGFASAGLGAKARIGGHFIVSVDVARTLKRDRAVRAGDWMGHVSLTASF